VSNPRSQDRQLSALPSPLARAIAFASICIAGLTGGAIGYSLVFALFLPVPNGEYLPPAAHIGPISWALVAGAAACGSPARV
jgi:hypothetical protein